VPVTGAGLDDLDRLLLRAYAAYPDIELIDDRDGRQFKVVVARPPS
jgi:hypothetical protein